MEKHTTSLEISKRLKELGVKQKSMFFWTKTKLKDLKSEFEFELKIGIKANFEHWATGMKPTQLGMVKKEAYSAFLASELGELLPARITNPETRNMDFLRFHKGDDSKQDHRADWTIEYHTDFSAPLVRITADTEANARGKMLIYLLENGLTIVVSKVSPQS